MYESSTVEVYNFHLLDDHVESPRIASFKATLEQIRRLGGEALPGTAQEVEASELDAEGRYIRVNTGWGALG